MSIHHSRREMTASFSIEAPVANSAPASVDVIREPARYLVDSFRFAMLRANAMLFTGGLLGLSSYNFFMDGTHYGWLPACAASVLATLGIRDLARIL